MPVPSIHIDPIWGIKQSNHSLKSHHKKGDEKTIIKLEPVTACGKPHPLPKLHIVVVGWAMPGFDVAELAAADAPGLHTHCLLTAFPRFPEAVVSEDVIVDILGQHRNDLHLLFATKHGSCLWQQG